jgi:uroporphyrinogen-III decarboxylase
MERSYYIELARKGLRMPIGADLVLKTHPDHEAIILDGRRLGDVVIETAGKFNTPLAFPLMDLAIEKEWIHSILGTPKEQRETFLFSTAPSDAEMRTIKEGLASVATHTPRIRANLEALRHVSRNESLLPVGMSIGPFSLITKLMNDPITAVYLAGSGLGPDDAPEVGMLEKMLDISISTVLNSIRAQIEAGARAVTVCEPAANKVYFSPKQIEEGADIFDRFVIRPNLAVREILGSLGADLIFHDCGELTAPMVSSFNRLDPSVLSLGSSRTLWEDARLIDKNTVLFGNLPTKKFYSDSDMGMEKVRTLACELSERMDATGHPFILGSECDVLSVPGAVGTIRAKVDAMLKCGCGP